MEYHEIKSGDYVKVLIYHDEPLRLLKIRSIIHPDNWGDPDGSIYFHDYPFPVTIISLISFATDDEIMLWKLEYVK